MKLHSERFDIIPFSEDFVSDKYLAWINDKSLMQYSEQRHRNHSKETAICYLKSFDNTPNYFWAIVDRGSIEHIGNINLYVDNKNLVGDIGILVGSKNFKGVGTEVFQTVIEFSFERLNLRKVTAGAMKANIAMIKVMEKCHMQLEGVQCEQFLLSEGKFSDGICMGLLKRDYLKFKNEIK